MRKRRLALVHLLSDEYGTDLFYRYIRHTSTQRRLELVKQPVVDMNFAENEILISLEHKLATALRLPRNLIIHENDVLVTDKKGRKEKVSSNKANNLEEFLAILEKLDQYIDLLNALKNYYNNQTAANAQQYLQAINHYTRIVLANCPTDELDIRQEEVLAFLHAFGVIYDITQDIPLTIRTMNILIEDPHTQRDRVDKLKELVASSENPNIIADMISLECISDIRLSSAMLEILRIPELERIQTPWIRTTYESWLINFLSENQDFSIDNLASFLAFLANDLNFDFKNASMKDFLKIQRVMEGWNMQGFGLDDLRQVKKEFDGLDLESLHSIINFSLIIRKSLYNTTDLITNFAEENNIDWREALFLFEIEMSYVGVGLYPQRHALFINGLDILRWSYPQFYDRFVMAHRFVQDYKGLFHKNVIGIQLYFILWRTVVGQAQVVGEHLTDAEIDKRIRSFTTDEMVDVGSLAPPEQLDFNQKTQNILITFAERIADIWVMKERELWIYLANEPDERIQPNIYEGGDVLSIITPVKLNIPALTQPIGDFIKETISSEQDEFSIVLAYTGATSKLSFGRTYILRNNKLGSCPDK